MILYATQSVWQDWYQSYQRRKRESARESAIYEKLKEGPIFEEAIKHTIPRKRLVEEIRQLVTPAEESRLYPLIIGEHGTGKTSLINLAVDGMDKPKGVVYVDIPLECDTAVKVAEAMQMALGWSPDPVIDSEKRIAVPSSE
jgi:KaiC/GvpD/RAD55 family RecA-like ATPase